tara:strand:- start:7538 stop:8521 length:984 start_codon:yes stop_codon:yes gene_type:complete
MKVLITGVAGLLGSRLADYLISEGVDVIGIDNLSGGYIDNVHPEVNFYNLDLQNKSLNSIFKEHKPEYVYHFAAYAAEGLSPFIRTYNYNNNLVSTANIVNECIRHNVTRLIFTSTMAVYGHGVGGVFDETQIPNPIDPYGVAKYGCEMDIQIAGNQHGLDWCIIRPHNVYGIKQNIWDKYRNVLGIWMYQKLNKQPITIYGDGTQTRAFSFIDDSIKPLWKAATSPYASNQIINLGGIEEITIKKASELFLDIVGVTDVIHLETRHEVHFAVPTYQKSIDILGFEYKTNLKDGLSIMWEWAKQQPMRARFTWPEYELDNGIYNFWK